MNRLPNDTAVTDRRYRPGLKEEFKSAVVISGQQVAVGAGRAAVDQRQHIQLGGSFKSDVARITDVGGGSKTIRQNNLTDLIIEGEIKAADIKIEKRKWFSANSIFKLKRVAFFEVAIYNAACLSGNQFPVRNWAVGLRYCAVKFDTGRANRPDHWHNFFF